MAKRQKKTVRKRPTHDDNIADTDGVNFVRAAAGLYKQMMYGSEPYIKVSSLPDEGDRKGAQSVARGLCVLRRLLNQELKRGDINHDEAADAMHAQQVLDCLTGGGDGPMRRYAAHLGAASQSQAPNRTERLKRSFVVGLVLAIQEAAKREGKTLSRRKATEMVLQTCPFIAKSRNTVEGWITHATAPEAQLAKDQFLNLASDTPKTALPFHFAVGWVGTIVLITLFS